MQGGNDDVGWLVFIQLNYKVSEIGFVWRYAGRLERAVEAVKTAASIAEFQNRFL